MNREIFPPPPQNDAVARYRFSVTVRMRGACSIVTCRVACERCLHLTHKHTQYQISHKICSLFYPFFFKGLLIQCV